MKGEVQLFFFSVLNLMDLKYIIYYNFLFILIFIVVVEEFFVMLVGEKGWKFVLIML